VLLVILRTSFLFMMYLTMVSVAQTVQHRKLGKDLEGNGGDNFLKCPRRITKTSSMDSRCPGRNLNLVSPEHKSEA
jgi:hypothetical protein